MKYVSSLLLRIALCLIPFKVFYLLFLPLTLYGSFLLLLPFHPQVIQNALIVNQKNFVFIEACVASAAYWLFWVLTLTIKDLSLKKRISLILLSFLLFFLMNLARIVILVFIDLKFGEPAFNMVHLVFWKLVSGVYVALVWIFLIKILKINSIPLYSDLNYLYKESFFNRRRFGKLKYPR